MAGVRNSYEQKLVRKSGTIAAGALKAALEAIKVGVTELEVDKIATEEIYKLGGDLSYKTVPGYKFATCVTVNDEVVHGVPTDRKFISGDLVSVDLAVVYKGWHTDCAWSVIVEDVIPSETRNLSRMRGLKQVQRSFASAQDDKKRFLEAGEQALWDGIAQAVDGNRVGDISYAIQTKIEENGYSVVRSLVGHGVGRSLHEKPEIPGFGTAGSGMVLKSGMSLAIEIIYTKGLPGIVLGADNWTYHTADGSWGGLFEMSVVVGKEKAEILTDWTKV